MLKIKILVLCVCIATSVMVTFAQTKADSAYIGSWSNGRAFQMFIENGTIEFDSKGNKTQTFKFRDVTPPNNGAYFLEIISPSKETYFSKFLSVSINADEMTILNYNSLADMKAAKNPQGSDTWFRDGVVLEDTVDENAAQIVKDLYAASAANKGPFFQSENRGLVDKYFVKELADMIWKDAVDAKGEVGAIDFDPLFYSQDPGESDIVIGKPDGSGGSDFAMVAVNFKSYGKPQRVDIEISRGEDKTWKISQISYFDGEDLRSFLAYSQDAEIRKEYDSHTFMGTYLVGKTKCNVTPTMSGYSHRVVCEGREGFRLYSSDGTEKEDIYLDVDDNGNIIGKFVFKNSSKTGVFIDAAGKSVKVVPVK